jgi:hypothetical protein
LKEAIYLVGHGPLKEPRPIELQHQRVLRYMTLVRESNNWDWQDVSMFVDLNYPRSADPVRNQSSFPQFEALVEAVKAGQYEVVYLDLQVTRFTNPLPDYGFMPMRLKQMGATVLNAHYDDGDVLQRTLLDRYGESAKVQQIDDGSDMVAFFPGLANQVASAALRSELFNPADPTSEDYRRVWDRLSKLRAKKPHLRGSEPFIDDRLEAEWQRAQYQKEKAIQVPVAPQPVSVFTKRKGGR